MIEILLIILCIFIYTVAKSTRTNTGRRLDSTKVKKYKCQDCSYSFSSTETFEGCPNCSGDIVDDLATFAGIWMLGDWAGMWGNEDDLNITSDPFSEENDIWNDEVDIFEDEDDNNW